MSIAETVLVVGASLLWIFAQELRHSRELKDRDQRIQQLGHLCTRLMEKVDLS